MKNIKHIVISGNIGVGKTTLSEIISKKFNWELQLEEVKDNPYLDDFYKSMNDWSFHLQIFFLNSRLHYCITTVLFQIIIILFIIIHISYS